MGRLTKIKQTHTNAKAGQPRAYNNGEELLQVVEDYFFDCEEKRRMPTKAGMALRLRIHRDTLNSYEKQEIYSDGIKTAYLMLEDAWNQRLASANATGAIFYHKNLFGYMDAFDHTSGGKPIQYVIPNEIQNKHRLVLDIKKDPEPIKQEEVAPAA